MRSEDLSRVIDAFGPSDMQKEHMLHGINRQLSARDRRKGGLTKVLLVATAISLFSATAAVALSNLELFRGIFGNSIYLVEDHILYPVESVADEQFRLTLEGVLSDAYSSTAIVSVEALDEQSRQEISTIANYLTISPRDQNIQARSYSVVELESLSDKSKKRYMIGFMSVDGALSGDLEIHLTTERSRLSLTAPTASTIPTLTIQLDEGPYGESNYVPQTVWISPLSVVVKGVEREREYNIPNPEVILHFANGTTIDVFRQETGFGGSRFPEEGITTVSAQFERIIDLSRLRFITVDGMEYPIDGVEYPINGVE